MDSRLFDHSHTLRSSVLAGLSLFLFAVALAFSWLYFNKQEIVLASLYLCFTLYSLYVYRLAAQRKHKHRHTQCYVYLMMFMICISTYLQPLADGLYLWTIFCPIVLYALLGLNQGRLMSGLVLLAQVISVYDDVLQVSDLNASTTMVNLILCYCGVWIVSHRYEFNRENIENSLTYLASRDALTGAHNRLSLRAAYNHFEKHRSSEDSLSLLLIDLDYFKQINDQYGHDSGDKVLIETAQILANVVGEDNLYRIGGEEFCVTLFDTDLEQAEMIGERLRGAVGTHLFHYREQTIHLTLSVGICEYQAGDKLTDLIKLADKELYRAKHNGRNQVRICQTVECPECQPQAESV